MSRLHEIGEIQGCGHLFFVVEEVAATNAFPSGIRIVDASENVATASWVQPAISTIKEVLGKDLGCLWRQDCAWKSCALSYCATRLSGGSPRPTTSRRTHQQEELLRSLLVISEDSCGARDAPEAPAERR